MVHVQSSWFPLIDRNPQKFMKIHEADAATSEGDAPRLPIRVSTLGHHARGGVAPIGESK